MATVTIANICVGAATLKIDGVDVGAITGGLTVQKATDVYNVEIDNVRAAIKQIPIKENFSAKTTMSEITLTNIRIIWNIPANQLNNAPSDPQASAILTFGLSTGVVEHTLEVTGVAPNGLTRVYRTYRAISVRASEHTYIRTKETLLPVEFDILPDLTKPAGQELGTITDYKF